MVFTWSHDHCWACKQPTVTQHLAWEVASRDGQKPDSVDLAKSYLRRDSGTVTDAYTDTGAQGAEGAGAASLL